MEFKLQVFIILDLTVSNMSSSSILCDKIFQFVYVAFHLMNMTTYKFSLSYSTCFKGLTVSSYSFFNVECREVRVSYWIVEEKIMQGSSGGLTFEADFLYGISFS